VFLRPVIAEWKDERLADGFFNWDFGFWGMGG